MIIGVHGGLGVGKDTLADILVTELQFEKRSFAHPIKQMAKIAWGFTDEQLWGPSEARNREDTRYPLRGLDPIDGSPMEQLDDGQWRDRRGNIYPKYVTPRLVLQHLGTEHGRRLHYSVWAEAALRDLPPRVIFTDMRFVNEFESLRTRGGRTLRLYRDAAPKLAYAHASEAELWAVPDEEFDLVVRNDGSLADLRTAVLHWLRETTAVV